MLTHRRQNNKLGNHVMLFASDGSNWNYGPHIWTLITNLQSVPSEVVEFAAQYYGCDFDEAEQLVNPMYIVGDAGAWDDQQFVSEVWQAMECGALQMSPGFATPDGAVVLDKESVVLEYSFED